MLTREQLNDLRSRLEQSQNPVFLYDNDADGLCSYALLRRFLDRGKGMVVRTHPMIDIGYAHKALALGADLVVVLDCPFLGDEFIAEIAGAGIPLIWIDHHKVDSPHYTHPSVSVFNPMLNSGKHQSDEPVTYICYQVSQRVEDQWIAVMGCIADHFLPPFAADFARTHPELWKPSTTKPFEAYYGSGIGHLAQALGFGLKDSTTHVVYLQNILIACSGPAALLAELDSASSFARKYTDIRKRYDVLLAEASRESSDPILFFRYSGSLSISSELANELSYRHPRTYILVAYVNGGICTMSLRGDRVKILLERLIPSFPGLTGGGHQDAVGARLATDSLDSFVSSFISLSKIL